ncbi:MAG: AAA family ATPase, partial [Gemmataceae bacterium]|nr:AAA family ATPase [Gemmataceae bacterium]
RGPPMLANSIVPTLSDVRNPRRSCLAWDAAEGFQSVAGDLAPPLSRDPLSALDQIDKMEGDILFVLKDFHECWTVPQVKRKLRSLAGRLKFSRKSILVVCPTSKVPEELKDEAVLMPLPPPGAAELESVLDRLVKTPGVSVRLTAPGREKLIQAALGLTVAQAQRVFAKAIVADGVLEDRDIDLVTEEKRQLIHESEALEFYPPAFGLGDVGGLDALKGWLRLRERAFTREAREYGLPAPKGIALIGIPGTGKSLVAKAIAGLWRLPLFRLDAGALFGSLVGESEERTRRALRVAETAAPALLWIDEVEKALAHGGMDSGTSTRVFGSVLTWMQEKTAPVFVVATANSIAALPPELLRKGRFDEIFFLDLPSAAERREILAVHLAKRRRRAEDFGLEALAGASEGYTGAELEQAVIDAMHVGFSEGREFTTEDVAEALRRQVPLSVSQRETIGALRAWLQEGRAQSASTQRRGDSAQG